MEEAAEAEAAAADEAVVEKEEAGAAAVIAMSIPAPYEEAERTRPAPPARVRIRQSPQDQSHLMTRTLLTTTIRPCPPGALAVVAGAIALLSIGCSTLPTAGRGARNDAFQLRGLNVSPPEGREWRHMADENGQHFVLLRDELADYVVLYSLTTQLERPYSSIEQLFARINTDPALEYESLEMGVIRGIPVIRFSLYEEDDGRAYELVRQRLQLRPRPAYPKYYTSSRGFMLLHPEMPDYFVTIACARTSYHGFIGSHFEQVSEDFFDAFVADNIAGATAPPAAIAEQVAGIPGAPDPIPAAPANLE